MTRSAVQLGYFDGRRQYLPGQIVDFGTASSNSTRGFPAEVELECGLGVVKGAKLSLSNTNQPAPFALKLPATDSTDDDFVGIVIRTEACTNNDDGNAAYAAKRMATATFNRKGGKLVAVQNTAAVTEGDDVYVSVDATKAPMLPAGRFHNAAGEGVIKITDAKWYQSAPAGVAIIEL